MKQVLCGQQGVLVWDSWDAWISTVATSPNLLSDHILHRISTGRGLSWRPLHRRDGRTHFGSINSLSHASSVFSRMTHLKTDDEARAKAGLWNEAQGGLIEKAHNLKGGKAWFRLDKKGLGRIRWCKVWD